MCNGSDVSMDRRFVHEESVGFVEKCSHLA
jgi:hypothetical protein